ncbi:hypothetical protein K435DRAFT_859608 [Dendrothele bispora CBS 962.96]|uniref:Uncharacterized protein n=1 Tax=Dendrothele bispora (strain CBS 962.96) TaxID=1314807 RepID=A0A4S8M189_DENBC|nr:hypothetical protein K435DRAFT_859608 [Dendrothele bispora CBS 962.96]
MSSYSTTATATYILQKYSRSCLSLKDQHSSEWQHFTNPTIKLVLDIKKSSNAELESVRLRIVWTMSASNCSVDQPNEIFFEDVDLLSFSAPSLRDQVQGLPLKAVYRDNIVGIRYLTSRGPPIASYRRFQIVFTTPSETSQFIDSISSVCPCKSNPLPESTTQTHYSAVAGPWHPGPVSYPTHTAATVDHRSGSLLHQPAPQNILRSGPTFMASSPPGRTEHFTPPLPPQISNTTTVASHFQGNSAQVGSHWSATSSSSQQHEVSSSQTSGGMSKDALLSSSQALTPHSGPLVVQPSSTVDVVDVHSSEPGKVSVAYAQAANPATSNTAVSSHATFTDAGTQTSGPFFSALREATSLDSLSHEELEKLVGDVIREDRFVDLMEHLSTMWRVKGYMQIH